MNWEWLGSEDPFDKRGIARYVFTDTETTFKLPSFLIAHNLAHAPRRMSTCFCCRRTLGIFGMLRRCKNLRLEKRLEISRTKGKLLTSLGM